MFNLFFILRNLTLQKKSTNIISEIQILTYDNVAYIKYVKFHELEFYSKKLNKIN